MFKWTNALAAKRSEARARLIQWLVRFSRLWIAKCIADGLHSRLMIWKRNKPENQFHTRLVCLLGSLWLHKTFIRTPLCLFALRIVDSYNFFCLHSSFLVYNKAHIFFTSESFWLRNTIHSYSPNCFLFPQKCLIGNSECICTRNANVVLIKLQKIYEKERIISQWCKMPL